MMDDGGFGDQSDDDGPGGGGGGAAPFSFLPPEETPGNPNDANVRFIVLCIRFRFHHFLHRGCKCDVYTVTFPIFYCLLTAN